MDELAGFHDRHGAARIFRLGYSKDPEWKRSAGSSRRAAWQHRRLSFENHPETNRCYFGSNTHTDGLNPRQSQYEHKLILSERGGEEMLGKIRKQRQGKATPENYKKRAGRWSGARLRSTHKPLGGYGLW
jgi:hypothetical protein